MSKTIVVTGALDAADTLVRLTAQGSVSAPSLVIPQGVTMIKNISGSVAQDGLADDGMAAVFLRLGGSAVKNGESTLMVAGLGNQSVQSGSDAAPAIGGLFKLTDANIEVNAGDVISIAVEGAGVDWGDAQVVVGLEYA